ncbi:putative molybdopterin-guanine dinucleotide biosynthesis protein A [Methanococcus vannielii SB]|uniref:Probable molybdenum cofactor guanylyltransferase n=1 Tax=Methanococcus vannielii (strain ATCC 35089 / DSM 1224 / JCM 13029 / OCM 148 / SB) TaxID=406327 RepID=A6US69_METVS|nr:molybdenum cofactor guanylyltransferase [Methanococcus vannielii]ABR55341.1 putative molybdopterin-guanine dinucleotide biosynthesis protein A [Methanococcus vannielii SB]
MISAVILSGGKAERMNGEKSFRTFGNKYLIENIADILNSLKIPFTTVFKNPVFLKDSSSEIEKQVYFYKKYNQAITWDMIPEMGPLVGMLSGMINCDSSWVLLVPCDMPFITEKSIENLINCIPIAEYKNCNAIVPKHENGFIEPIFALYHRSTINALQKIVLETKEKKCSYPIRRLIDEINPLFMNISKIDPTGNVFLNINTIEELNSNIF